MPKYRILGWYNQNLEINHNATDYDEAKKRAEGLLSGNPKLTIEILETRARVKASTNPEWSEYFEVKDEPQPCKEPICCKGDCQRNQPYRNDVW